MNFASSVGTLELDSQGSEEALTVSSATYIRLLQQLRGKPLFPRLKKLCIEDYYGLVDLFPLFLSPNLRTIRLLNTKPPTVLGATASVMLNLICDFAQWLKDIQYLYMTQGTVMPMSLLDSISLLSNLRTLEISTIQVGSFQEFRPLAPLALKSLTLKLSCSSYIRLPDPITSSPDFLESLEKLDISGPRVVVVDFVQSLESQYLTSLAIEARDKEVECDQHGKKPVSLMEAGNVNVCDFGSMLHTISLRWGDFLREITITPPCDSCTDFAQLSGMPMLEKIHVSNCPFDGLKHALKSPAVWHHLDTLYLSVKISYPLLSLMVLSAPHLKKLNVCIDTSEAPSTKQPRVFAHPLKSLGILDSPSQDSGWGSRRNVKDLSDLPRFIRIARYLNAMFPKMEELTSDSGMKIWEVVWQLVVLCQISRADEIVENRLTLLKCCDLVSSCRYIISMTKHVYLLIIIYPFKIIFLNSACGN